MEEALKTNYEELGKLIQAEAEQELKKDIYNMYNNIYLGELTNFEGVNGVKEVEEFKKSMNSTVVYGERGPYTYTLYGDVAKKLFKAQLPEYIRKKTKEVYDRIKGEEYSEKAYIQYCETTIGLSKVPLTFKDWLERD